MLSRRTTLHLLALLRQYFIRVTGDPTNRVFHGEKFYHFLFENDYPAWFMNLQQFTTDGRTFENFFLKVHTGESLFPGTPNWPERQREQLGNRFLVDLSEDMLQYDDRILAENAKKEAAKKNAALMEQLTTALEIETKTPREGLISSLELDGYLYRDGKLYFTEAAVLDVQEEQGFLEKLVKDAGLADQATIKHHLKLSAEHYETGKWDDSISNSRKVLEAVLEQSAAVHSLSLLGKPLKPDMQPREVRDYLQTAGLVEEREKKAISEIYGLLSNTGGHPYMAEKDQARLMRHLALTLTQFVLLRLQGSLQKSSP